MSIMPRVYFCGGSGGGKTTLAEHVSKAFNLSPLPSAAKAARESMGLTEEQAHRLTGADRDHYQMARWYAQVQIERDAVRTRPNGWVSERCIDPLVYTSAYAGASSEMFRGAEFTEAFDRLRGFPTQGVYHDNATVVFLVRATRESIEAAADGRRDRFLDWDQNQRHEGALEWLLESNRILYFPVAGGTLIERVRLVTRVVALAVRK